MCGILITKNINLGSGSLQHRGPDYQNTISLNGYTFQHFRLSIQDTSLASAQPIWDKEKNQVMCYNGELYNASHLKKKFLKGYPFRTTGDTEVVFKLIQKYGPEICKHFDGIFTIAYMDKDTLYLIRDHFGVKPLYFYYKSNKIIVSSEISIINCNTSRTIEQENLPEFIAYKYNGNSSCIYKDVYKVAPGEIVKIGNTGIESRTKFFDIKKIETYGTDVSKDEFKEDFEKAVISQKVSDVPYGLQLSGGVDSTLIAACFDASTPTFSTVFGDYYSWDERQFVEQVANLFHFIPRYIQYDHLYAIRSIYGAMPFSGGVNHPHTFAIEQLAQYASREVKILFSGEGADELFWGYDRYKTAIKNDQSIIHNAMFYNVSELKSLFEVNPENAFLSRQEYLESMKETHSYQERLRKLEFAFHLENLLERYDLATMKYGIEGRVPFLSTNFAIKYLGKSHECFFNSTGKKILKEVCGELLGPDFAYRKKIGYRVPLNEFIHTREIDDLIFGMLQKDIVKETLKSEIIQQINNQTGVYRDINLYSKVAWTILNLGHL